MSTASTLDVGTPSSAAPNRTQTANTLSLLANVATKAKEVTQDVVGTKNTGAAAEVSGQAKGEAHKLAGEAKGKTDGVVGEAKGKASELAGEAKGKASELAGKAKGTAEQVQRNL